MRRLLILVLVLLPSGLQAAVTSWSVANYLQRVAATIDNTNTGKPFLLSLWGYHTTLAAGRQALCLGATGTINQSQFLDLIITTGLVRAAERDAATQGRQSTGPSLNTWYHLAGAYVATADRWTYLNGTGQQNTSTTNVTPAAAAIYLGVSCALGAPWDPAGALAEASIWQCCANLADRDALNVKLAGGDNPLAIAAEAAQPWTNTLVAYWRLSTPTDLTDLTLHGHDLTMTGTLTTFGTHPPVNAVPAAGGPRRVIIINQQRWEWTPPQEWLYALARHLGPGL
jgi:hypothetical protein